MHHRHAILALACSLVGLAIAACSSSNATPGGGTQCTPGNNVYCRCEDRVEGTKKCNADGKSFAECVCDGSQGPVGEGTDYDAGLGPGNLEQVDGGKTTGLALDAKCIGKVGVVAGSADDLDVYVAAYSALGEFAVSKSTGPALRGPAQVASVSGSLISVYPSRFSLVVSTKLSAGSWSAPNSVGNAMAAGSLGTAVLGNELRVVYLGQDKILHFGTFGPGGWDSADTRAEPPALPPVGDAGTPPITDVKGDPAAATAGNAMTVAYATDDGTLWRNTYSTAVWTQAKFPDAHAFKAAPAIVALDGDATKDMLLVYAGSDLLLHASFRDTASKVWSAPIFVDSSASSTELTLAALPGGKALLVYRGSNGQGYYSTWASGTGFAAPAELVPGKNPELASIPSVTRGGCDGDAVLAFADKAGPVKLLTYTGGKMSGTYDVPGIPKATFVGVGEMP